MDRITEPLEEEKKFFTPIRIILALFLVLLIIVMIFPEFSIRLDPEPETIPQIEDVVPEDIKVIQDAIQPGSYQDFKVLIQPNDPVVKQTADKISSISCSGEKVCSAKAIFYFVRDNFDYVSDPREFEYVKSARESLATKSGDCDDSSVLLSNLLQAIGIEARLVFIPEHVFVQARIKDYRKNKWLDLDPTCKTCRFDELPYQDYKEKLEIIE